jgi:hypothetical protein
MKTTKSTDNRKYTYITEKFKKYRIKKDFSSDPDWVEYGFNEGEIVYEYPYYTYGCLSSNEDAVSEKPGKEPFFGVDRSCLEFIEEVTRKKRKNNAYN